MASIRKRRGKFYVVYYYINEDGDHKQKWEPYDSETEAKRRKSEVEYKQRVKNFIPPQKITVREFLVDFVNLYGTKKWGPKTYEANCGLISNYINPIIGDTKVQDITRIVADRYISQLQKTPSVSKNNRSPKTVFLTPCNIERINRLLKCAFGQAIRWDIVERNPFAQTTLPKIKKVPREIWTVDNIRTALSACTDNRLFVAMNLSFACSLRVGEILGLTWDNIHISDGEIARGDAYLYVEKELSRIKESTMETLNSEEILKVFPRTMCLEGQKTRIVLKVPKTESSVRKVWIPETLAYILREWRDAQERLKRFLGDEYYDHGLVVSLPNGRPCETKVIDNAFNRLKEKAELPNVVFHSLRHSSATYKMILNGWDLKATQGDTGHAQVGTLANIYAHILDENRRQNAQVFESVFYGNTDLREVHAPAKSQGTVDLQVLLAQLQQSPELLAQLATMVNNLQGGS